VIRVLVSIGTRPEAIKLAPVVHALRGRAGEFEVRVLATGQHEEMLEGALAAFGIDPDVRLGVMAPNQTLPDLTARLIERTAAAIASERPDLVLVQGDTTTVFATTLAAFYANVAVGHVEAGLRTFDLARPFPEEANRKLTAVLTRLHFAPTEGAKANLVAEGVPAGRITISGNTVIDALLLTVSRLRADDTLRARAAAVAGARDDGRRMILVTGHRRESFGAGFRSICDALASIASRHPEVDLVYPVHLNPNVLGPVHDRLGGIPNVHLLDPVDYVTFVHLMDRSHLIVTDSGGIQEEAPSLHKPVLVMRDETERPEAISAGTARLVGTDRTIIEREVERLLGDPAAYAAMAQAPNPFGDGRAAIRIRDAILTWAGSR
jgi:UDP-N-acetylglucosamine 2-epimerase (non-hydrolysing)